MPTGIQTLGDREFIIKSNPQGYYYIDTTGKGQRPGICDELFTNTRSAKIAIQQYQMDNAATFNKKKVMDEAVRKAKAKLENGKG
jgi:hypothetical protein